MKKVLLIVVIIFSLKAKSQQMTTSKKAIITSVEKHENALIDISDQIWALAETAFEETQSAKILANYAEKQGF